MNTNQRFIASILAGGLLASPALAQTIPPVGAVSANVGAACGGDLGLAVVQASCLTAISGAIEVAALYGAAGNATPQIELGFMLCQVANAQPAVREAILDLIANSGIPMLQTGCSSALQTAGRPNFGGGAGNPADADDCRLDWDQFGFRNQGQCIRFVNTGKDSRVVTPA